MSFSGLCFLGRLRLERNHWDVVPRRCWWMPPCADCRSPPGAETRDEMNPGSNQEGKSMGENTRTGTKQPLWILLPMVIADVCIDLRHYEMVQDSPALRFTRCNPCSLLKAWQDWALAHVWPRCRGKSACWLHIKLPHRPSVPSWLSGLLLITSPVLQWLWEQVHVAAASCCASTFDLGLTLLFS